MILNQLIHQLATEGHIQEDQQPAVATLLTQHDHSNEERTPWYLRGLVGIGAWIAAILLLIALSSILWFGGTWSVLILGIVCCVGATVLYAIAPNNIFLGQLSLAVSLAGQVQFAIGMASVSESTTVTCLSIIILQAVLIAVHPDLVLRFLATFGIVAALVVLLWEWEIQEGLHLLIVGLALGTLLIWYREADWITARRESLARPLGYALPIALFGLLVIPFIDAGLVRHWWISTVGLLLLLLLQVWDVLHRQGLTGREPLALALLAGVALLGLPALHTPGLLAALSVTILGIQRGNRLLTGAALGFLAIFLGEYYYNLDLTLLVKSLVLLGTGGALLVLRAGLLRFVRWPEEQL